MAKGVLFLSLQPSTSTMEVMALERESGLWGRVKGGKNDEFGVEDRKL